ncbi:methyl-accepting chemotaxis protein [Oryzifoliimicrobium ureilyticus]|uniref:methyl-accepting chemotaxis protein n=1 Tax=Oryzifoliimicrobium ureilyticus TaxID=3113724 RepID=UPI00307654EF
MFIDKVLSRFKIKTKVVIFVLPFVISISAVGLTGLYASGLLQGRMEISNSILQSLSGFKDLYGSMNDYLRAPSEQARDKLNADLKAQQGMLQATLSQIGDGAGREDLEAAISGTGDINGLVSRLWNGHQTELALHKSMEDNKNVLIDAQAKIGNDARQMEDSIKKTEGTATAALRAGDRLLKAGESMTGVINDYGKVSAAADKLKFVIGVLPRLNEALSAIESAVPANQKNVVQSIAQTINDLKTAVSAPDAATDESIANIGRLVSRFRQTATYTQLTATQMMRGAASTFVELDSRIVQSNAVLQDTRRVQNAVYDLELALADFNLTPTKASRAKLQLQSAVLGNSVMRLLGSAKGLNFAKTLSDTITPALNKIGQDSQKLLDNLAQENADFTLGRQQLDTVWKRLTSFAELQKQTAGAERQQANGISFAATALGVILSIAGGIALVITLQRPIGQITAAMRRLADGALDTGITGEKRGDEIGDMARALGIFKENAISKVRIEEQSEQERAAAEAERQRNDEEKRELDRQIELAVTELAAGLERMSQGDISVTIDRPFIGRLEQLRQDFNASMLRLQATMRQIRDNVQVIQGNGGQMAESAEGLSRRTEQQAASLEETAAAVEEITVTVRSSAERAREAEDIVIKTKKNADESSAVVGNAINAMKRIEDASQQIEQIIDVIDDIAFQTNLLALNAGIEAARAGEAGKGFAVVAMEVRELAQRSAAAANEIKDLINKSTTEVTSGAQYVQQTGSVLSSISAQIVTISQHVEMIARASQDQSVALQEVNTTVAQMDQMTQQNAAMVEETTAASRELSNQADDLLRLVEQFRIEAQGHSSQGYYRAA